MKCRTVGFSARVGDAFAVGVKRYADSSDNPLWRFHVSKFCGGPALVEADATEAMLRELRREIDRVLDAVSTDGGRLDSTDESAFEPVK